VTTDYDRVAYRSIAYPHTHPARLAALAAVYGGEPPPVDTARVLEIGCGAGGNLLPMAAGLPGAVFVGVDPAASAITEATATAAALGLGNLTLHATGIEALPEVEPFDYVIAHGVLSWMPPAAREALWAFLARTVSPHGVVYLSFNVLPGWSTRGVVRDLMRWHVRDLTEPTARITAARALLATLCAETPPTSLWGAVLHSEQRVVAAVDDWYLFHDHLAEHNQPFWFAEVAERAAQAGLGFVADAEPARSLCPSPALAAHAHTAVEASQYGDLSRMTTFREVVWSRAPGVTAGAPRAAALAGLSFWLRGARLADGDRLRTPEGAVLTLTGDLARGVVRALEAAGPAAVAFAALQAATGAPGAELAALLLHLWLGSEAVGAVAGGPAARATLSSRPVVWPLARNQAAQGPACTNLRHEVVPLTPLQQVLVQALDGTRDRAGVEAALRAAGLSPTDDALRDALVGLARAALLVA
jgi:SAM-dependent methyltransferase